MKRFWSFLLIILFLGFSAHVQAQKKGKKTTKNAIKRRKGSNFLSLLVFSI